MGLRKPVLVGIAGGSGSGKTTLVDALLPLLPGPSVSLLHQDDYYRDRADLSPHERARLNFDHPSALDNRLLTRHLRSLLAGQPVESPRYSFESHRRLPRSRRVEPADIVLVEGILLFHPPALRGLFDVKVFVDAAADLRLARRLIRDTGPDRNRSLASVVEQYLTTVRPMHERYVEPSRAYADLVVTDATDPAQVRRVARLIKACVRR